jgi:hypothetical protein
VWQNSSLLRSQSHFLYGNLIGDEKNDNIRQIKTTFKAVSQFRDAVLPDDQIETDPEQEEDTPSSGSSTISITWSSLLFAPMFAFWMLL